MIPPRLNASLALSKCPRSRVATPPPPPPPPQPGRRSGWWVVMRHLRRGRGAGGLGGGVARGAGGRLARGLDRGR